MGSFLSKGFSQRYEHGSFETPSSTIYFRETVAKTAVKGCCRVCVCGHCVETDEQSNVIPEESFTEMGDPIVTNVCAKCHAPVHQCDGASCEMVSGFTCHCCWKTMCFACEPTYQNVHSVYRMQWIWCNHCFDRKWGASARENSRDEFGKCTYHHCHACNQKE